MKTSTIYMIFKLRIHIDIIMCSCALQNYFPPKALVLKSYIANAVEENSNADIENTNNNNVNHNEFPFLTLSQRVKHYSVADTYILECMQ